MSTLTLLLLTHDIITLILFGIAFKLGVYLITCIELAKLTNKGVIA